ncbi:MAG: ABC transporter substrate binding protein [Moritella sp.]|uniref:ABC transporter substrate binding protein n=1 Tax=Moritella sp. TaxID=78556 RepID=UPI0029A04847|nr:ABC transporter substrate binding protein [Moritella sp.]MDX2321267.1 ABC transporter substrate binding protein [Moritella sp.]
MERSHLSFRHIGISRTLFLICLLYLLSAVTIQARQLRVAVSALDSGAVVERVQAGMHSELTRQGYITGSNLIWVDNNKPQVPDVNVTISMSGNSPFISLVNQQGSSTDILFDETHLDEDGNVDLMEYYEVNFINKLLPGINTLGVIVDSEVTDISQMEQFLTEQKQKGVQVIYHYIGDSSELRSASRALVLQVDAIYLPCHITDMPDLNHVVMVAERNNVALIGEDHGSINKGIFAVYNIDYVQVGRDTADLLVRLAAGGDSFNYDNHLALPVLSINLDAAVRMGVELSSEVIDKAKYIIE